MDAICVVLAIMAFFMLALALETVIFGGMSLQLMVVTILGIILLILLALAFILVCARVEGVQTRHQYGNLVFIATKRRRLPYYDISLSIACVRERSLYRETPHGRYMCRELGLSGPAGRARIRKRIGIISDAVYADGLVIDTRHGKEHTMIDCMGADDVEEDLIPVLGSDLDSTM